MPQRILAIAASSNLQGAVYDPETLECRVTFKNGAQYVVSDVSTIEAEQFESAGSSGQFYNEYFRNGKVVTKA